MSFEVFLHTCNLSDKTEPAVNPFTGETVARPVGESVTDDERKAIALVLASANATSPDEFGFSTVRLADGGSAEICFAGLEDACEFSGGSISLHSCSMQLTQLVYALADAGNLLILPAMVGSRAMVTSTANAERVVSRWPDVCVIASADELHTVLTEGFDNWKRYRDHVVRDSDGEMP